MEVNIPYLSEISSTTQENRYFEALSEGYVSIDEKTLEDHLIFTYGLSKLLNYYNLKNEVEGDWSNFLVDELVVLATIAHYDPLQIEKNFNKHSSRARLFKGKEKKLKYFKRCIEDVYAMALLINTWLGQLREVERFANISVEIREEIKGAIQLRLGEGLQNFKAYVRLASQKNHLGKEVALDFEDFGSLWAYEETEVSMQGDSLDEKVDFLLEKLKEAFKVFFETLIYLKKKAQSFLNRSLENENHYPEVALLIAFIKLLEIPKSNINQLSQKYLEFFYKNVLKQENKPAVHDKTYLSFKINEENSFVSIPENTAFIAGYGDKGENILYTTEQPITVNKAVIKQLNTIYVDSVSINTPKGRKNIVKNILSNEVPIDKIAPVEGQNDNFSFPAFGESQMFKSGHEKTMDNASIGFAIASPNLFLQEGKREITISLQFEPESFQHFTQLLGYIEGTTEEHAEDIFSKAFLEAFEILITCTTGWYNIPRYVVKKDDDESTITLKFDLEIDVAPVIAFNGNLHEGHFQTKHPVVKFLLNGNSYIYPYSLLEELVLQQILIDVEVSEVKDLFLSSETGTLSQDSPFFPFGATPHKGSFLLVGNNEVFQKNLDKLEVHIKWFNLPIDPSGFYEYYDTYNLDIDNGSYEIKLSVLDEGRWKPLDKSEQQVFKLFRTTDDPKAEEPQAIGELSEWTIISNVDITKIKLPANYREVNDEISYSNAVRRGFIRLELANPPDAFGHQVYPAILSEVITENSRSNIVDNVRTKIVKKEPREQPNMPYTPQIESIHLNYASSSAILLNDRSKKGDGDVRGNIFHLHAFGTQMVYPDSSQQRTYLLPVIDFEGCLLIGLDKLELPQTVSMLFEMDEGYSISSEEEPPMLEWCYLNNDQWILLASSKILKDETKSFIKTGIVEVDLPRSLSKNNTILPNNLYWIRIAALKNVSLASKILSACTQVGVVSLVNEKVKKDYLSKPLPAFSIRRAYKDLRGIQQVIQPLASFQGKAQESEQAFYTRVGERLKHKNRAITAWDYERIVLDKFPVIQKITCLTNMSSKSLNAPGHILLVVTPYADTDNNEPKTSSEVLYQIKSYLNNFISPFVSVEVRNPAYERIRIICNVKFKEGYSYGFYIQKLNEEINNYLAGGLLLGKKTVELGGKVNISDILSFIRTLPYIDFITKFSMIQIAQDLRGKYVLLDTAREGDEKMFLQATKPWSVLIPSTEHQIHIIGERSDIKSSQAGIDDLELGTDFIIGE